MSKSHKEVCDTMKNEPPTSKDLTESVNSYRDEGLVDRSEMARRLRLHERTVSRMVDRGELPQPCLGHGGRPRWLWSYVVEYCRKRHEQQARRTNLMK